MQQITELANTDPVLANAALADKNDHSQIPVCTLFATSATPPDTSLAADTQKAACRADGQPDNAFLREDLVDRFRQRRPGARRCAGQEVNGGGYRIGIGCSDSVGGLMQVREVSFF